MTSRLVRRIRWGLLIRRWPAKEFGYVLLPRETVITPKIRATVERIARERGLLPDDPHGGVTDGT